MKNYGRLDIYEENGNHININGEDINYNNGSLIFEDDIVNVNASGNSFGINSYNSGDGVSFNSNSNLYTKNSILFNTDNILNKKDGLFINSDSVASSYNDRRIIIGENVSANMETVLGNDISINSFSNVYNCYVIGNDIKSQSIFSLENSYFVGNDFVDGNGLYTILPNSSLTISVGSAHYVTMDKNSLVYSGKDGYSTYLEGSILTNSSTFEDNIFKNKYGYWDSNIITLLNSVTINGNLNVSDNGYLILSSNSLIGSNSIDRIKSKDSIIFGNNVGSLNLNKSIYLVSGDNQLIGSNGENNNIVFLWDGKINDYSIKGSNKLQIGKFEVNTETIKYDGTSCTYEEMYRLLEVDEDYLKLVSRVNAKVAPSANYDETLYENILKNTDYDGLVYEFYLNPNELNELVGIIGFSPYMYNGDLFDVVTDDGDFVKLAILTDGKIYKKDLSSSLQFKYAYEEGSGLFLSVISDRDVKIRIKLSNAELLESYKTKIYRIDDPQEVTYTDCEVLPRSVYKFNIVNDSTGNTLYGKEISTNTLTINNNVTINELHTDSLKGVAEDSLGYAVDYIYNYSSYIPGNTGKINNETETIESKLEEYGILGYENDITYYTPNSENYDIDGTIDNYGKSSTKFSSLSRCSYLNDGIDHFSEIFDSYSSTEFRYYQVYNDAKINWIKWGSMASFSYTTKIKYNITDVINVFKYHGNFDNYYYKFIPFALCGYGELKRYKAIGGTNMKIKCHIYNTLFSLVTEAMFNGSPDFYVTKGSENYSPMIGMYNMNRYTNLNVIKFNGMLDYGLYHHLMTVQTPSTPTNMETETLTYMTEIF